jgi:hypothetical protein
MNSHTGACWLSQAFIDVSCLKRKFQDLNISNGLISSTTKSSKMKRALHHPAAPWLSKSIPVFHFDHASPNYSDEDTYKATHSWESPSGTHTSQKIFFPTPLLADVHNDFLVQKLNMMTGSNFARTRKMQRAQSYLSAPYLPVSLPGGD